MSETNATLEPKVTIDATTNASTNSDDNNTQASDVTSDLARQAEQMLANGNLKGVLALDKSKVDPELYAQAVKQKIEMDGIDQEKQVKEASLDRINNLEEDQKETDNSEKVIERKAFKDAQAPSKAEAVEAATQSAIQRERNFNPQTSSDGEKKRNDKVTEKVAASLEGKDLGEADAKQAKSAMDEKIQAALSGMGADVLASIKASFSEAGAAPSATMNATTVAAAQPVPAQESSGRTA